MTQDEKQETEKEPTVTAKAFADSFKASECFEYRLLREMRLLENRKKIKQLSKGGKMTGLAAKKEAQRLFGFMGLEKERAALASWLSDMIRIPNAEASAERARRSRANKRNAPFESAVANLPATASPSVEMDWVKSHPAMTRKDRQKNTADKILITPDDILKAPNGKCPSRSAAQLLQHYANKPDAFFKELLSETKKAKSQEDEAEAEKRTLKTNSEIAEMLDVLFPGCEQ